MKPLQLRTRGTRIAVGGLAGFAVLATTGVVMSRQAPPERAQAQAPITTIGGINPTVPGNFRSSGNVSAKDEAVGAADVVGSTPTLIQDGSLNVRVAKAGFERRFESISALTKAHNGYVLSMNINDASSIADVTVRVPSTELQATMDAFARLGQVKQRSIDGQDVSIGVQDADSQIAALRARIAVEKDPYTLQQLKDELANEQSQLNNLKAQAAESTLTLHMATAHAVPAKPESTSIANLGRDWHLARHALLSMVGATLLGAVVGFPIGLLALFFYVCVRRIRSKVPAGAAVAA